MNWDFVDFPYDAPLSFLSGVQTRLFLQTAVFFGFTKSIVFADIAGFTKWSDRRDPGQVFCLLERIYGIFDVLAKQRGVFKIETIVSCLPILVTGCILKKSG